MYSMCAKKPLFLSTPFCNFCASGSIYPMVHGSVQPAGYLRIFRDGHTLASCLEQTAPSHLVSHFIVTHFLTK